MKVLFDSNLVADFRGLGHETSYYQPEVALQVFRQTMNGMRIEGT